MNDTSTSGARTTVKTSRIIAPVRLKAPPRSNAPRSAAGVSRGTTRHATASSSEAMTTGAKNTQRHPIAVSSPPTTMPSENPAAATPA